MLTYLGLGRGLTHHAWQMSDLTVHPSADYAEVQGTTGVRKAQSSSFDEVEAGQKVCTVLPFLFLNYPVRSDTHIALISCSSYPAQKTSQASKAPSSPTHLYTIRTRRERKAWAGRLTMMRGIGRRGRGRCRMGRLIRGGGIELEWKTG